MPSEPGRPADTRWERLCRVCDGIGSLDSPAWVAWHRERSELSAQALGAADVQVGQLLHELADRHRRRPPPEPERLPCAGCGGLGAVTTTEGDELLAFVRRHLRPS